MTQPNPDTPWLTRPYHRQWLRDQAEALFAFYGNRSFNPKGGFFELTATGTPIKPVNPTRGIHGTARMVHCFAIGSLLGRPGSDQVAAFALTASAVSGARSLLPSQPCA